MERLFDDIFSLIENSFPKEEYRCYKNQKALLKNPKYKIFANRDEKGNLNGFISSWKFEKFNFIEHFAVNASLRGKGVGSKMLKEFIKNSENPIILEVEIPTNEISRKRINFYEKNGFFLNTYDYFQKPLRKNSAAVKLYLMSYPKKITSEEFENIKNKLYSEVYVNI